MKWMFALLLVTCSAFSAELGEDVSNVECTKSIHRPRPIIEQIKTSMEFSEESVEESTEEVKTITK